MIEYDPRRSEFARASRNERLFIIGASALMLAGAFLTFTQGGLRQTAVLTAGSVIALTLTFFVPTMLWRIAVAVAAVALMVGAVLGG